MSEAKHTKGQLTIYWHGTESNPRCILTADKSCLFQTVGGNDEANAERLVKVWNAHDRLTERIKKLEAARIKKLDAAVKSLIGTCEVLLKGYKGETITEYETMFSITKEDIKEAKAALAEARKREG